MRMRALIVVWSSMAAGSMLTLCVTRDSLAWGVGALFASFTAALLAVLWMED